MREGKPESELVFAPAIEDIKEVVQDDADNNKTADEDGAGKEDGDDQ